MAIRTAPARCSSSSWTGPRPRWTRSSTTWSGCAARPARSRSGSRPTTRERALFWKGRKSAFAAVGRISPDYIVQDGVIPRTALPEVLRRIAELSRRTGVRVANVFHAGDGNLHPLVLFDDAVDGPGRAGRGGLRRDPRPVHRARWLDHRRARRGHGQGQAHAAHVHRRRPGHHAAACGAPSTRPGWPTRARSSRRRGCAARCRAGTAGRTRCRRPASRRCSERGCAGGPARRVRRCRPAGDGDAIAGVPARFVAAPGSADEAAAVVRAAAVHDLSAVVRGAATKLDWGSPPERLDLVLDTRRLTGVVEHAAGDLIVVVRAGTPLADLSTKLAAAGQQLALDAPLPGATVGGTVAVNTSGPRRMVYGTVRDLLIGVTVVRPDGVVARAGGKVVKNVAGYDLGKLVHRLVRHARADHRVRVPAASAAGGRRGAASPGRRAGRAAHARLGRAGRAGGAGRAGAGRPGRRWAGARDAAHRRTRGGAAAGGDGARAARRRGRRVGRRTRLVGRRTRGAPATSASS